MHLYLIRHGQSTNNHLYATQATDRGRAFDPELTGLGRQQAKRLAEYLCAWKNVETQDFASRSAGTETQNLASLPDQTETHPEKSVGAGNLASLQDQKPDFYHMPLTHLYTSPTLRAVDTGLASAEALGLQLVAWRNLHEGGGLYLKDEETGEDVGQPGPDRARMARRTPRLVWPPEMGDGPWWNRPTGEPVEEFLPRARRVLAELLTRHPPESSDSVAFFTHARFCNDFIAAALGLQDRAAIWFMFCNTAVTCIVFRPEWRPAMLFLNYTGHLPAEMVTE